MRRWKLLFGLAAVLAVSAVGASSAFASLTDEVAAGRIVARAVYSGKASCASLNATDFEHLGEYVMERTLGSLAVHRAMNARMDAMLGAERADRMHELLGRRYARCRAGAAGGAGMMSGGRGVMMGAASPTWMRGSAWRHMSRADWQRVAGSMMRTTSGSRGWSTGAVLAAAFGALVLGATLALALLRHGRRAPPV